MLPFLLPLAPLRSRRLPRRVLGLLVGALLVAWPAHLLAAPSLSAGQRALDAWQLEEAMRLAAPLLRQQPSQAAAQVFAAEVMHQRGLHATALGLAESAGTTLLTAPDAAATARLQAVLPQLRASAQATDRFACRETLHFRLCYADKDEVVATYAEEVLEAAYAAVGKGLQFYPAEAGEKIAVEFYANAAELAGATGLRAREIETSGTIAVCRFHRLMVLSPLATSYGYAWADTLAHEFVHLVVSKKSHNRVPVWLHEGLAKTWESAWRGNLQPQLEAYPQALLARASQGNTLVPLARMHPSMAKLKSQQEAALAFAEVFSLVGYMRQHSGEAAVPNLLAALGQGSSFEAALAKHVAPLPQLEQAWRAQLHRRCKNEVVAAQPAPPSLRLRAGNDGAAGGSTEPMPPTDAIDDPNVRSVARLGELLALRGHARAAARSYEAAELLAKGRFAALSFRLAQALVDAGETKPALAVLQRAAQTGRLQQNASHVEGESEAQLLFAQLLAQTGDDAGALRYLRAYNLQNPFNPTVHRLAADCHGRRHEVQLASREQRFAELSARPRAARPPAQKGTGVDAQTGQLSVLPSLWLPASLDGGPLLPTPLWQVPVATGEHCVQLQAQASLQAPAQAHCTQVQTHEARVLLP